MFLYDYICVETVQLPGFRIELSFDHLYNSLPMFSRHHNITDFINICQVHIIFYFVKKIVD